MKSNCNEKVYSKSFLITRIFLFTLLLINYVKSDLPVHCKREAIDGHWTFKINKVKFQPSLKNLDTTCGHGFPDKIETTVGDNEFLFENYLPTVVKIKLESDYKVYENGKIVGNWTPVYDEGFILKYKQSVFTAFMKYYKEYSTATDYISNCDKTMIGWYIPDEKENNKNWHCFFGLKDVAEKNTTSTSNEKSIVTKFLSKGEKVLSANNKSDRSIFSNVDLDFLAIKEKLELEDKSQSLLNVKLSNEEKKKIRYEDQSEVVKEINSMNLSWKANIHKGFSGLSLLELSDKLGLKRKKSIPSTKTNKAHNVFQKLSHKRSNLKHTNKKQPNFIQVRNHERNQLSDKNSDIINDSTHSRQHRHPSREKDGHLTHSQEEVQKYLNTEINDMDENLLADNWDWRNINGINFVPRLRVQGSCGSCYIFSTVSSLESRLRINTYNKDKTEFSRQFPLSCSFYTEGCDGGYPILVGKFFNEFEIVPDECFEYEAKDVSCSQVCDYSKFPKKYTVSRYEYIGGFYGATSEVEMMKEIRARGPIPGNISVPWTFSYYSQGIYTHEKALKHNVGSISKTTLFDKKISWEKVDHSILIIGWGQEKGVKYWIGMNTWGEEWGENGFFRILRGENECSVESMGDVFRIKHENRFDERKSE